MAVQETATNAFVETTKIKREVLAGIKEIVKTKEIFETKKLKVNRYMDEKGISYSYSGTTLFVNSKGDYPTIYEYKL